MMNRNSPINNLTDIYIYDYRATCSSYAGNQASSGNKKLKNLCDQEKGGKEITFGTSIYDDQECGQCVEIKCVDDIQGAKPCKDRSSFYQMKTDNGEKPNIGSELFDKKWDNDPSGPIKLAYYKYKKIDCSQIPT